MQGEVAGGTVTLVLCLRGGRSERRGDGDICMSATRTKQITVKGLRPRERRRLASSMVSHREALLVRSVPLEDIPDEDPAEVMQLLINRVTQLVRHAAAEADRLKPGLAKNQSRTELEHEQWSHWDEQGNLVVMSNYWLQREADLRVELGRLSEKAQALGLGERRAKVQEAQFMLLGEALQKACAAAGLSEAVQKRLGSALREELTLLEGGMTA